MNFLKAWKVAIEDAHRTGKCGWVYRPVTLSDGQPADVQVARTMHPSFMGVKPVKHDPKRDA